ncbi:MAG: hypothetical protein JWM39_895 [Parcubacteria group bacterium]|nr:hypothetical protein [Parcubacteria group bacterium]
MYNLLKNQISMTGYASFVVPFFFLLVFSTPSAFASSCTRYGNTTMCDDGTSYTQYGNTIMGNDGTSYTQYGNTLMGSNGTSYTRYGNTTMGSDGSSYTQYGNTIMGNDGSSYTTYGNTTMGSGGGNIFNSCPSNSSYNYSTGKCSCSSGYTANYNKTGCIYGAAYNYIPPVNPICGLNSYYDGVSSCKCNSGYAIGNSGSCVAINQVCQSKYGLNSYGSGLSCYCSTGYQWNSSQTSCIATPVQSSRVNTTAIPPTGTNCSVYGNGAEAHGGLCYCSTGYQWDATVNSCLAGYGIFTRNLNIGSTGKEVVNLKNLLAIRGLYTGLVSTPYDKNTAAAVSLYQALHYLPLTGTVGPQTKAALNKSSFRTSY